jgi:hypothetical protein
LSAIAYLIYADAIISPSGSAMTFSATASRLPFAFAREGYLPAWLGTLNRRGVPFRSLVLCYVTQLVVIILLPDWGGLLSFITAVTVLVYATAPLALGVLRQTAPDLPRPYRLRFARLTAPAAFVIANLLLIWVGWATDSRLFLVVAFGALILLVLALVRPGFRHTALEWVAASWIVPYAGALCAVSYLSPYGGGRGTLSDWACALAVTIVSLAIYVLAPAARHDDRSPVGGRRPTDLSVVLPADPGRGPRGRGCLTPGPPGGDGPSRFRSAQKSSTNDARTMSR